ncbi:MAG: MarR family transcriptional regulator [Candidatus Neomarinimicrobiota bacterium]
MSLSSIEESTGFLCVRTARSMKKKLDARLVKFKITSSQHTVLSALLENNGLSLSEIGNKVFLDKPAITGLADRLEKDNLVERKRTTADRRVVRLYLTEKGRKLLLDIDNLANEVDGELVSVLSGKELQEFRTLLNRIWSNANGRNSSDAK